MKATAWWAVLAVGCASAPGAGSASDGPLESRVLESLERVGGCGDVVLFAASADDSVALRFEAEGVAEQAHELDEVITWTYELGSQPMFEVIVGAAASADICATGASQPESVYTPVGGRASLTVGRRNGTVAFPAHYEVELQDAVVANEAGHTVDLSWWSFVVDIRN